MSCEVERMNYGGMLVSHLNCSAHSNVLQQISQHYRQLQGAVGELGRVGQEGSWEGEVVYSVSGMSALGSGREAELSREGECCAWAPSAPEQRCSAGWQTQCSESAGTLVGAHSGCEDGTNCFLAFCFSFKREVPLFSAIKGSYWCPFSLKALDCLWQTIQLSKHHYQGR